MAGMDGGERRHPAAPAGEPVPAGDGPLISVVVPVYNACRSDPRYLREALASVLHQSYGSFELIVVDDGSTDGSAALCEEALRARPDEVEARLLHKPNGGQSSARNFGARHARGEWVSFLDQDDQFLPDKLARVAPLLQPGVDMVYTDVDSMDADGRPLWVGLHRDHGCGGAHPKSALEDVILRNVMVVPGVMTLRRDFFLRLGGFDETLSGYEDDDLFLRVFQAGTIAYLPESTMRWRMHGQMYSSSTRHLESRLRYWRKLLAEHAAGGRDRRRTRLLSRRFASESMRQAVVQLRAGNPLHAENVAVARTLGAHLSVPERVLLVPYLAGWCRLAARHELVRLLLAAWWRVTAPRLG
jgi:glycosyltransferase involved in cell wall biosynthesis